MGAHQHLPLRLIIWVCMGDSDANCAKAPVRQLLDACFHTVPDVLRVVGEVHYHLRRALSHLHMFGKKTQLMDDSNTTHTQTRKNNMRQG